MKWRWKKEEERMTEVAKLLAEKRSSARSDENGLVRRLTNLARSHSRALPPVSNTLTVAGPRAKSQDSLCVVNTVSAIFGSLMLSVPPALGDPINCRLPRTVYSIDDY